MFRIIEVANEILNLTSALALKTDSNYAFHDILSTNPNCGFQSILAHFISATSFVPPSRPLYAFSLSDYAEGSQEIASVERGFLLWSLPGPSVGRIWHNESRLSSSFCSGKAMAIDMKQQMSISSASKDHVCFHVATLTAFLGRYIDFKRTKDPSEIRHFRFFDHSLLGQVIIVLHISIDSLPTLM
jgi:hypothetical protein